MAEQKIEKVRLPECTCGRVWRGHPNPHAITCPSHLLTPVSGPCHVERCVEHINGMHVDWGGDAVVHVGCDQCVAGTFIPSSTPVQDGPS